jgi:hypothetical protein
MSVRISHTEVDKGTHLLNIVRMELPTRTSVPPTTRVILTTAGLKLEKTTLFVPFGDSFHNDVHERNTKQEGLGLGIDHTKVRARSGTERTIMLKNT